ncbi:MAG TPA: hypothetical protein PLI09_09705 [Candidatus Hydrogenedentes bacterium]|nr:hypothetical protein [Candidatus Hydrogenedentota bacterium]
MRKSGVLLKVAGVVAISLLLTGCPMLLLSVSIVGDWQEKYSLPGFDVIWTFESDGTFVKETKIPALPSLKVEGDWSLDIFDSKLTITIDDDDTEYDVDYDSDDEELTLEDSHGVEIVLVRD